MLGKNIKKCFDQYLRIVLDKSPRKYLDKN